MNGIYAANLEELQELMRMIDMLDSQGLDTFIGWFRTSDAGIAISPRAGLALLYGYIQ